MIALSTQLVVLNQELIVLGLICLSLSFLLSRMFDNTDVYFSFLPQSKYFLLKFVGLRRKFWCRWYFELANRTQRLLVVLRKSLFVFADSLFERLNLLSQLFNPDILGIGISGSPCDLFVQQIELFGSSHLCGILLFWRTPNRLFNDLLPHLFFLLTRKGIGDWYLVDRFSYHRITTAKFIAKSSIFELCLDDLDGKCIWQCFIVPTFELFKKFTTVLFAMYNFGFGNK